MSGGGDRGTATGQAAWRPRPSSPRKRLVAGGQQQPSGLGTAWVAECGPGLWLGVTSVCRGTLRSTPPCTRRPCTDRGALGGPGLVPASPGSGCRAVPPRWSSVSTGAQTSLWSLQVSTRSPLDLVSTLLLPTTPSLGPSPASPVTPSSPSMPSLPLAPTLGPFPISTAPYSLPRVPEDLRIRGSSSEGQAAWGPPESRPSHLRRAPASCGSGLL